MPVVSETYQNCQIRVTCMSYQPMDVGGEGEFVVGDSESVNK